jgi:DNA-binding response OmpR family regulator
MIRLLLVEDDSDRHAFFTAHLPKEVRVVWARSGGAALAILKKDEADTYHGVLLDYDLYKQGVTADGAFTNGGVVAKAVAQKLDQGVPVLVHSMNTPGAMKMVTILAAAGFDVTRVPFNELTPEKLRSWVSTLES